MKRLFSVYGKGLYIFSVLVLRCLTDVITSEVKIMPSAKILEQKKQQVNEMVDKFQRAASGVLVDYRGLTVEEDTKLRAELRQAEVEYAVVKNTLTRFAADEVGFNEFDPILNGPTALALSFSDVVAPAKILVEYSKKNEKLEIKGGFIEGKVVSVDEINALASLPSKEVLVAKLLGSMKSPIQGFTNVLNGNLSGLARVLQAIADKKAAAGE